MTNVQNEPSSEAFLAVVIVNWNTRHDLMVCLSSCRRAEIALPHQIWVVDNASSDGSADAVLQSFPEVQLLRAPENLGFAAGNNLALEKIRATYVLLLNPDTIVSHRQIETLVAHLEEHPEVGVVGPRLVYEDGSFQLSAMPFVRPADLYWEHARFPAFLQPAAQRRPRRLYVFPEREARDVEMVIGAVLLIRGAVIAKVGLLDPAFYMYAEEMDWCFRVWQAGYRVQWLPTACVTHIGGRAAAHVPLPTLSYRFASTLRFLNKHFGATAVRQARALLALAALQNAILATLLRTLGRIDRAVWRRTLRENQVVLMTALRGRAVECGHQNSRELL
ncbi:MAG: glycosyltransferase family 2 protein [Candidatus Sericytochromatia bacterium]|nr:glycosyltransferase family 2 protein [Candidatus Sericytochromatia bacterium]